MSIVVAGKRSCFNSRARFFLYLANDFPFASTHGPARSFWCMIAETANLAAASGVVKEEGGRRSGGGGPQEKRRETCLKVSDCLGKRTQRRVSKWARLSAASSGQRGGA